MFIPFLAAAAVATVLFELGALAVWVKVLSGTVGLLLLILIAIGVYALWKRYRAQA